MIWLLEPEQFLKTMEQYLTKKHIILFGDFNININEHNILTWKYLNRIHGYGWIILNNNGQETRTNITDITYIPADIDAFSNYISDHKLKITNLKDFKHHKASNSLATNLIFLILSANFREFYTEKSSPEVGKSTKLICLPCWVG